MVAKQSLPVLRTNTTRPLTATTSPVSWPGSSADRTDGTDGTDGTDALPEQIRVRRDKRAALLAAGVPTYPVEVPRTHTLAEIRAAYPALEPGQETGEVVAVSGRVVFVRNTGKLCFATIQDGIDATSDGEDLQPRLQVMISLAQVGEEALAQWKAQVDLGDIVWVRGQVISSRRGELSVLADEWGMAAKSLRPLPNLYDGAELSEEARVRQRYVDLIVRPAARDLVRTRAAAVRSLRELFHSKGFIEIETPMLQTLHGGAAARPFVTHMNALDIDLYLRIAPELFLKRAVVGGIERVFEINRSFRNEGADSSHSPEFATLEAYEAYSDYNGMAELTRTLVQQATIAVYGSTLAVHADGSEFDLGGNWESVTLFGALSEAAGEDITVQTPMSRLREVADRVGVPVAPHYGPGCLLYTS